jgi:hypothetical protein
MALNKLFHGINGTKNDTEDINSHSFTERVIETMVDVVIKAEQDQREHVWYIIYL